MPELPEPRCKPLMESISSRPPPGPYAELQVVSNFSFLRGASHPEELIHRAAEAGLHALAITDINTLAGVVRAFCAAKELHMPLVVGCCLHMQMPPSPARHHAQVANAASPPISVLVYPMSLAGYANVCQLLTCGKRRTTKGKCLLTIDDLLQFSSQLLAIAVPPPVPTDAFAEVLARLRPAFDDDRLSLALSRTCGPYDAWRDRVIGQWSREMRIPMVAVNDVHYHLPHRQALQDVLTCIRLGTVRSQGGLHLAANAERHIKTPAEMQRLFADMPQAVHRSVEIANRALAFSLDQIKYQYPSELCPPGKTMMNHLVNLTWQGARQRYPQGVPQDVVLRLTHEFELIHDLNYAAYFLTVEDIVRFARSKGILCQGRGAAANSAVCYCLGITAVDPTRIDLLVERFISRQRNEPPDIDIDFEHQRRQEVIDYLYRKYGVDRVALTAEVITYRRRSALRDVGKALGFSLDAVDQLSGAADWWEKGVIDPRQLRELGLNPADPTMQELIALAKEIQGFPRHLSQHVGGFIITAGPLHHCVPVENTAMPGRTIIEWDKDDIDAMGILKVDILALGMLSAIRRAIDLVNQGRIADGKDGTLQLHTIPPEDPAVYDMLCRADSIGVFQVESRAQMTMLPRLKPRCYYDLVIEVAIVRPGPIVGDMVHPYLRRRNGEEPVDYPDEKIRKVLERTLGVPLFQEQAMALVMAAAGFTPDEADQLRRAMAAWKRKGHLMEKFEKKITVGMTARGYSPSYAQAVFNQIRGFGEYGFPESHAASFALLVYVSAWLKCHHPAAFCAALLNSQPMGFYHPAQLLRDAAAHGVSIQPVDINKSQWESTIEYPHGALRLGMSMVHGASRAECEKIIDSVRRHGPFSSPAALWRMTPGIRRATLQSLASADAFNSMGLDRQAAIWAIKNLRDVPMPLFADHPRPSDHSFLPPLSADQLVLHDYAATGFSLKAHPMSFFRSQLDQRGVIPNADIQNQVQFPHGSRVALAGLVLVRQRPATAKGIIFMTIEDETGVANLVIKPPIYEKFRRALRFASALVIKGKVERRDVVVHILVYKAWSLPKLFTHAQINSQSRDFH
jgi:error-prone DNA polymerase